MDEDTAFTDNNTNGGLYLAYGDQLTVRQVRVCKQRRMDEEDKDFEKWKWILPIPAFFHLQMAVVHLIQHTHYGSEDIGSNDRFDHSKLRYAQERLNRRRVRPGKNNSDFYPLEQFLIHNFNARIIAAAVNVVDTGSDEDYIRIVALAPYLCYV